jgi:O-antigen ligase
MSLVYGSVTAGMICLLAATVRYASSGLPGEFFYTSFSILLHPTYFGLLLLTSCIFLGEEMSRLEARQRTLKQYLILTANLCMLALLGSKINYLGIVLIGLLILFISLKKRNFTLYKDRRLLVAGAGGLLFFLVITSYFNRSTQVIQAVTEKSGTTLSPADQIMVDSSGYNSTTIRIAQWKYSLELGSNMPFYGVGTGDEVEDLRSVFRKHNDPYALLHFGHAHSHYLHYWLMLGVAGFLLVLFSLVIPLIRAIKQGDHATLCFFSLLLLIGLTDILSHATIGACYAFISGLLPTEDKKN